MDMVVIASSPRAGSSLISDILTQAEAGYVAEHFNFSVHVPRVVKENQLASLEEHFRFITQNYCNTHSDIFTVKCHFDQFFNYSKRIDILSRFQKTEFVQIKRKNTLDQAISYFLAKATDTWSSRSGQNTENQKKQLHEALRSMPGEKLYNDITRMSFRLHQNEAYWDFYLKDQPHHLLYYEDLVTEEGIKHAESTFTNIYRKRVKLSPQRSHLRVQRDSETSQLIKDKISPFLGSPPSASLLEHCFQFNNNFYDYVKS